MGTNKGTSSDPEEISDAKFTIVSQFLSKAKRQPRREAWFGPGSSWNPFRKPTKPNESYAKEQFRAAESTINKSTPTTSGTGHSNTAKTTIQNLKLRHDVKFDSDLHFRPNLDGENGQRKNHKADALWKLMMSQLSGCLNDREKLKEDEIFLFSSEQANKFIDPKTFIDFIRSR
ncbi:hypothetical protein ACHAP3_006389 [Botrytis cinerea]